MGKSCGVQVGLGLISNPVVPWPRSKLRYAFGPMNLRDSSDNPIPPEQIKQAIRAAFDTWHGTGVGLTFTEVAPTGHPDIQIESRPSNDPDGESMGGNVVAHATLPNDPLPPLPLSLHFDESEQWGFGTDGVDIESVALHEIGHNLGLGHSDNQRAVMYRELPGVRRVLHPDDRDGINVLYGRSPAEKHDAPENELRTKVEPDDINQIPAFHRAANRWASGQPGFCHGVPDWEFGNEVRGVLCIRQGVAEKRDAPISELTDIEADIDNPGAFHRAANRWVSKHAEKMFQFGIPDWESGAGVRGIICIKRGYAEKRDVSEEELKQIGGGDINDFSVFHRAANRWASEQPDFCHGVPDWEFGKGVRGVICFKRR